MPCDLLMVCALLCVTSAPLQKPEGSDAPIIDSALTLRAALAGEEIPAAIRRDLTLVTVSYWSFDHRLHQGQVVIHKELASDVRTIFAELKQRRFPIAHVIPIARYRWSDEASMAANNSSGFNYRLVPGKKKLSNHAFGRAIDINPVQNPFLQEGRSMPPGAVHDATQPGTITDGPVVRIFEKHGWRWGGRWHTSTDWQHFDKVKPKPDRKPPKVQSALSNRPDQFLKTSRGL